MFQKALGVQRRHAAGTCAGDGLAVDVVLHVTGSEHAGHTGLGGKALESTLGHDIAVVHGQLTLEDLGIGRMADGNKAALQRDVFQRAGGGAFETDAGNTTVVAQHFFQGLKGFELNLARGHFFHQLVHQDGLGLELVAAVHQVHLAGDVGQIERLFHRRVAAAHNTAHLVAVEKAVAGGAARHAAAHEGRLGGQAQVLGRGAGGQNQGVAGVSGVVALEREGALAQVYGVDVVKNDFGFETLCVLQKALHQFRALHAVDVGRPVVHLGGGHELAALGHAGDQHRVQIGARGVDGSGVTGRPGAQDQNPCVLCFGHRCLW